MFNSTYFGLDGTIKPESAVFLYCTFSLFLKDRFFQIIVRFQTKREANQSPQLQRLGRKSNFAFSKCRYDTFHKVNNKGADQSVRMRRLICTFVVHKLLKTGFLAFRPIYANCHVFGVKI